jgi:hypothetical protein
MPFGNQFHNGAQAALAIDACHSRSVPVEAHNERLKQSDLGYTSFEFIEVRPIFGKVVIPWVESRFNVDQARVNHLVVAPDAYLFERRWDFLFYFNFSGNCECGHDVSSRTE